MKKDWRSKTMGLFGSIQENRIKSHARQVVEQWYSRAKKIKSQHPKMSDGEIAAIILSGTGSKWERVSDKLWAIDMGSGPLAMSYKVEIKKSDTLDSILKNVAYIDIARYADSIVTDPYGERASELIKIGMKEIFPGRKR